MKKVVTLTENDIRKMIMEVISEGDNPMRYHVWCDSESVIDDISEYFDTEDEAYDFASAKAHEHDGEPGRVILHIEDTYSDETIDTVESLTPEEMEMQGMDRAIDEAIAKVIKRMLNEDVEGELYGLERRRGADLFDAIDDYLSSVGNARVSRFHSDDSNIVIAVERGTDRHEVKNIMSDMGYDLYDCGSDGESVMMTFKPQTYKY